MDISKLFPEAYHAVLALEGVMRKSSMDPTLYHLIKIRASQINGCAYCINMHTRDARAAGETEQRIYCLDAWAESPFYTEKERAALALTESVTLVAATHVPDDVYEAATKVFTAEEVAQIVMANVVINAWNRISVASRNIPD